MQYLGIWLLLCFALQGMFGVLIARVWTRSVVAQVIAGCLFVTMPTLLNRAQHPALCAHWVLLWALWLYFRWRSAARLPATQMVALALTVGLIHPYLAVMSMAVLCALGLRSIAQHPAAKRRQALSHTLATLVLATSALVAGWWISGLFVVTGSSMARPGLTLFSMNLLAPITPQGWSSLLPDIPIGAGGQAFEGFHYMGAGILALVVTGLAVGGRWRAFGQAQLAPLLIVSGMLAAYSLSPRITVGSQVLLDFNSPLLERLAVFGVTGRFFWPFAYVALSLAIAAVVKGWLSFGRLRSTPGKGALRRQPGAQPCQTTDTSCSTTLSSAGPPPPHSNCRPTLPGCMA